MQPKLFVPFNVRNKIINEDGLINNDISDLTQKSHYSTLTSYMKESKIYNAFMKRQVDGLNGKTLNFGINYDNFKKGISDSVKDIKYALDHPYSSLNCGFIINPSRFASSVSIEDTSLKAYWKFNESSGDIINQSESAVDLGSGADLQVTGATYSSSASPLGNSLLFDGVNDYAVAGTSLTQFDYHHNTTAVWTTAWWMKNNGGASDDHIFATIDTDDVDQGFDIRFNDTDDLLMFISNGAGNICTLSTASTFVPDATNWYFYTVSYDQALGSNNMEARRDNANVINASTSGAESASSAGYSAKIAVHPRNTAAGHSNINMSEMSDWNKVLSDDDQTSLYNGGAGLEIY